VAVAAAGGGASMGTTPVGSIRMTGSRIGDPRSLLPPESEATGRGWPECSPGGSGILER